MDGFFIMAFLFAIALLTTVTGLLLDIANSMKKIADTKQAEVEQAADATAEQRGERILPGGTARLLAIEALAKWGLELREQQGEYPHITGDDLSIELGYSSTAYS